MMKLLFFNSLTIGVLILSLGGCSFSNQFDLKSETINQDIFAYLYQNRQKLDLCQGEIDQDIASQNLKVYPIDQNTAIIEFLCFLGAYQGNYQYFLYEKQFYHPSLKSLVFEAFEATPSQQITKRKAKFLGGLTDYDTQRQTLTLITQYRGLADCGAWAQYQWHKDQFKLVEYRMKTSCDGRYIEPENYTKVYPH